MWPRQHVRGISLTENLACWRNDNETKNTSDPTTRSNSGGHLSMHEKWKRAQAWFTLRINSLSNSWWVMSIHTVTSTFPLQDQSDAIFKTPMPTHKTVYSGPLTTLHSILNLLKDKMEGFYEVCWPLKDLHSAVVAVRLRTSVAVWPLRGAGHDGGIQETSCLSSSPLFFPLPDGLLNLPCI